MWISDRKKEICLAQLPFQQGIRSGSNSKLGKEEGNTKGKNELEILVKERAGNTSVHLDRQHLRHDDPASHVRKENQEANLKKSIEKYDMTNLWNFL